jgi:PiT family inorganic phosphate transporter
LFILVIILSVGFAVVNGAHDAANAIATVVGTRVLSPMRAVVMAAAMNLIGAATGLAVASTIGKGIVSPDFITVDVIAAALVAAIVWEFITLRLGMPVSGTHSLIAGLIGAGIAQAGTGAIEWSVLTHKVLPFVVVSPAIGFVAGYIVMVALLWICRRMSPLKVEGRFSKLQILSAAFMAYSHGRNDGQMPIGLMAVAWMLYQTGSAVSTGTGFHPPVWIIAVSATAIACGTALGGWRVIKTLGVRMTALKPVNGFAAETAAASVIATSSVFGIPVSTTHCITFSIMGVGSTKRLSAVRWGIAGNIVLGWIVTFPICVLIGWVITKLIIAVS